MIKQAASHFTCNELITDILSPQLPSEYSARSVGGSDNTVCHCCGGERWMREMIDGQLSSEDPWSENVKHNECIYLCYFRLSIVVFVVRRILQ